MPVLEQVRLSLDTFHARYADEKPWFEYWDGEAVQKSMPTRLHSLIQKILVKLLDALGYDSGQEITLKLDPNYEPVPDVIAAEGHIGDPYPTEPFEVVIEILSPESPKDSFSRVLRKCHLYANWGIRQVVVIDPKARLIRLSNCGTKSTASWPNPGPDPYGNARATNSAGTPAAPTATTMYCRPSTI
jgi:Uma2 family endonuclease